MTGIGVISAVSLTAPGFFDGLCCPTPELPLTVPDFDPAPLYDSAEEMNRHSRFTHLALACAEEALAQAGDLNCDPSRVGVNIGTGLAGLAEAEQQALSSQAAAGASTATAAATDSVAAATPPITTASPYTVPLITNAPAAMVSIKHGFRGPSYAALTACATGTQSIGSAAHVIRWGQSDIMLAGGAEAANSPLILQGFASMRGSSITGKSCPFDLNRDGFLQSEGAATLVLEARDHALARNATILAEVLGSAANSDAYHVSAPSPGGVGAQACMELALQDANLAPADISHINAHGTSTPLNDANEAEAIHRLFGSPGPLVTSTKGVTGHAFGASGAMEAVAIILAMLHKTIPPTANYQTPDPDLAPIRIATEPTPWEPGAALSNSFGLGGHNATLILAPADWAGAANV